MKIIHTGDLHIGKMIHEFSMLKDQEYVLNQMISIAKEEEVNAFVIAGDIYDRSIPPADAVRVFDEFVSQLSALGIPILLISGNHDSGERLSFASSILEKEGFYISGSYDGEVKKITLQDEYGNINFYLLPYVKPPVVKYYHGEEKIHTYEEAIRVVIDHIELNEMERNVLVTHYFITNLGVSPECSDSENEITVGGVDNIDVSVFQQFDYVALGHIHGPQKIGREEVRYAGSPLKYSFSEVFHKKSVTIVELEQKDSAIDKKTKIYTKELKPLHDMRKIKGKIEDLISEDICSLADTNDYLQITLTNQEELFDAIGTLRSIYPNVMQLLFEKNMRDRDGDYIKAGELKQKSTLEIYQEFYEAMTDHDFDEERKEIMSKLIDGIEGGDIE